MSSLPTSGDVPLRSHVRARVRTFGLAQLGQASAQAQASDRRHSPSSEWEEEDDDAPADTRMGMGMDLPTATHLTQWENGQV